MGGVDGVITSFAVAAGASLTASPRETAAIVGFSSLVADGLSMGVSEYLSSASEAAMTSRAGHPILLGLTCFLAFVCCGTVPLLLFVVARARLVAAAGGSLVLLLLLGAGRARVGGGRLLTDAGLTAALGALAGAAAYGVAVAAEALSE